MWTYLPITEFLSFSFQAWLQRSMPFLLILFAYTLRQDLLGVVAFAWLHNVLSRCDQAVVRQVALREARSLRVLAACSAVLAAHAAGLYVVFRQQRLWRQLAFLPPAMPPRALMHAIFVVVRPFRHSIECCC